MKGGWVDDAEGELAFQFQQVWVSGHDDIRLLLNGEVKMGMSLALLTCFQPHYLKRSCTACGQFSVLGTLTGGYAKSRAGCCEWYGSLFKSWSLDATVVG